MPICAKYVHVTFNKKYKIFNTQNSETNLKITTIISTQFLIKKTLRKIKLKITLHLIKLKLLFQGTVTRRARLQFILLKKYTVSIKQYLRKINSSLL